MNPSSTGSGVVTATHAVVKYPGGAVLAVGAAVGAGVGAAVGAGSTVGVRVGTDAGEGAPASPPKASIRASTTVTTAAVTALRLSSRQADGSRLGCSMTTTITIGRRGANLSDPSGGDCRERLERPRTQTRLRTTWLSTTPRIYDDVSRLPQ